MDLPDPWRGEEMIWEIILGAMREGGEPIVFQYLVHSLLRRGEDEADRRLQDISPEYLMYEKPLVLDSKLSPTAIGVRRADPGAPEIHLGFVPALRELADFFSRQEPGSPAQASPVIARGEELGFASNLSPAQLGIVGHLLDAEGIGRVQWHDDSPSSWGIELGLQILRYRRIAVFNDYVRIKSEPSARDPK